MQLRHDAGDLVERLGILVRIAQKNAELSDRDAARDRIQRADQSDARIHDAVDKSRRRIRQAAEKYGAQARLLQPLIQLVEAFERRPFLSERLHDLLPLDHFVDKGGLFTTHGVLCLEMTVAAFCDKACGDETERRHDHDNKRNRQIHGQHKQERSQNGQHAGKELCCAHEQAVRKRVHIRDDAAHKVAGRMGIQIRQGKRLDLFDRRVPKIP